LMKIHKKLLNIWLINQ